jgi:outer membrane protein OmpA-like peptidoglycan-associated protein
MLRPVLFLLFFCYCLFSGGLTGQVMISEAGLDAPRETNPVLRGDGAMLYFTRPDFVNNKGTDNAADIWTRSRYADGSWGRALNPGSPINSFAHDRVIGLSPDGSRMAVLRTGSSNYVDLLETSGRNWRIIANWPVPADVATRFDLTFDLNGQQIIYSAYDGGNLDLFRRRALTGGKWSNPSPLTQASGPGNETGPSLAADGRTLYFQRDGRRWFRQSDPGTRPMAVAIPTTVIQFSTSLLANEIIAALAPTPSQGERLQTVSLSAADLPAPVELYRNYLTAAPAPGESTVTLSLIDGQSLVVTPDALNRYALFLRSGENIAGSANVGITTGKNAGLATTGLVTSVDADRNRLQTGIETRQRELNRLDVERRKHDLVAPKTDDPELAALRDKYRRTNEVLGDTLPPATNRRSTTTERNDRYAAELAELERMKAKFRKQQNDKLNQKGGSTNHAWTEKSAPPATPTTAARQPLKKKDLTRAERERAYQDSLRLVSEIRNGLQHDVAPRAYERQAWENEVRRGLPQTEPLSPDEVSRLDAEYQRQLAELETLRAKLHMLEAPIQSTPPTYQTPATSGDSRDWTARSPDPAYRQPATTAPATYDQPLSSQAPYRATSNAGYSETRLPGAPMPAGISFIPNTAYPDMRGYNGLDQLIGLVRQSNTVLEIRVHTPTEMDRRAAQLLSEERATTIRNFLLDQAISPNNFIVTGFGNNVTGKQGERVEVVRK